MSFSSELKYRVLERVPERDPNNLSSRARREVINLILRVLRDLRVTKKIFKYLLPINSNLR